MNTMSVEHRCRQRLGWITELQPQRREEIQGQCQSGETIKPCLPTRWKELRLTPEPEPEHQNFKHIMDKLVAQDLTAIFQMTSSCTVPFLCALCTGATLTKKRFLFGNLNKTYGILKYIC